MKEVVIYLSLIICLIGLVLYLIADKYPKVVEIGRIMFWVGLLSFLIGK
jgi:hypothetical protein